MLVRELKAKLDELGMKYEEAWESAAFTRNDTKVIEVFYTEKQMEEFWDGESISLVCIGGWKEVERRLRDASIL